MAQQITQDVTVDVTVKGGTEAVSTLESLDKVIQSILGNAKGLSGVMDSLSSSIKKVGKGSGITKIQKQLQDVQKQAQKTTKSIQGVTGYGIKPTTTGAGAAPTEQVVPSNTTGDVDGAAQAVDALDKANARATKSLNSLSKGFNVASKSSQKANFNFFRTRAIMALIVGLGYSLFRGLKSWFDLASDYAEANHLFYTTLASSIRDVSDEEKTATLNAKDLFGNLSDQSIQVTQEIYDAVESLDAFGEAMLLDTTSLRRTYATFFEMANAAGVAHSEAIKLSQGITQLTYDLSSLWDVDFADTANRLQGALSGVSTSVRTYGIDVSRTAADAWLLNNGFETTYRQLDRANKMIVIYNMLMERTASSQNDLARSALQPANLFRILGQQASIAGRQLGAAVFPIVTKLIPLFIMLAQAIQRAAAALSSFLGNKLGDWYKEAAAQWDNYLGGLGTSFDFIADDADDLDDSINAVNDSLDSTKKKLKEIRDFQLGFDELHVLPDITEATTGKATDTGGDVGGISIPAVDPYSWDGDLGEIIIGDAKKTLQEFKDWIDSIFGKGTWDAFVSATDSMAKSAINNFNRIKDSVDNLVGAFIALFDWPELLRGFADGFNAVTTAAAVAVSWVLDLVAAFLGLDPIKQFFQDNSYEIGVFLGALAGAAAVIGGFNVAIKILGVLFSPLGKLIGLVVSPLARLGGLFVSAAKFAGVLAYSIGANGLSVTFKALTGEALGGSGALSVLGRAFTALSGPVGVVIAIIGTLVAAFIHLWNTNEDFKNTISTTWEGVRSVFEGFWSFLQPIFDLFKSSLQRIGEAFGVTLDDGMSLWDMLANLLAPVLVILSDAFAAAAKILGGVLTVAITAAVGIFDGLSIVIQGVSEVVGGVIDAFRAIADFWSSVFRGDADGVKKAFDDIVAAAGRIFSGLLNIITAPFRAAFNTVDSILSNGSGAISRVWNAIKSTATTVWNAIKNAISNPIQTAKNTVTNVVDSIKNGFTNAINTLKNSVTSVFNNIKDAMTSPITKARDTINGIVEKIKGVFNFKWSLPSISLPSISINWDNKVAGIPIPKFSVKWHATGGLFDDPSIVGLGESGPEAIVPLSGQRKMAPFANAIAAQLDVGDAASAESDRTVALDDQTLGNLVNGITHAIVSNLNQQFTADVYLNATKVNDALDQDKRTRGVLVMT